jgi:hypothetical protein
MKELTYNKLPLEKACKNMLLQEKQTPDPNHLYSLQLMKWGLPQGELVGEWKDDKQMLIDQVEAMFSWNPNLVEKLLSKGLNPQDTKDPMQMVMFLSENLHIQLFENNNPA